MQDNPKDPGLRAPREDESLGALLTEIPSFYSRDSEVQPARKRVDADVYFFGGKEGSTL